MSYDCGQASHRMYSQTFFKQKCSMVTKNGGEGKLDFWFIMSKYVKEKCILLLGHDIYLCNLNAFCDITQSKCHIQCQTC